MSRRQFHPSLFLKICYIQLDVLFYLPQLYVPEAVYIRYTNVKGISLSHLENVRRVH